MSADWGKHGSTGACQPGDRARSITSLRKTDGGRLPVDGQIRRSFDAQWFPLLLLSFWSFLNWNWLRNDELLWGRPPSELLTLALSFSIWLGLAVRSLVVPFLASHGGGVRLALRPESPERSKPVAIDYAVTQQELPGVRITSGHDRESEEDITTLVFFRPFGVLLSLFCLLSAGALLSTTLELLEPWDGNGGRRALTLLVCCSLLAGLVPLFESLIQTRLSVGDDRVVSTRALFGFKISRSWPKELFVEARACRGAVELVFRGSCKMRIWNVSPEYAELIAQRIRKCFQKKLED